MIFYNFEGYFGKRKQQSDENQKPTGPDTGSFDYKKWQWHLMVWKLVDELNLTPEEVYKMNYIDCLNWLSMFYQRDQFIEQQQK
jgi:hypothetical protein